MKPESPPPPSGPLQWAHWLRHELRLFFVALQFLTRVPVPAWVGWRPEWMPESLRHYPMVGVVVGTFGAGVLAVAMLWWPPAVAVGLSMAATVWLTGGFHEDGWADTCDGLGGAVTRERALAIMKDSRLGTYGALGLMLLLGLKATVLTTMVTPRVSELNSAESSHVHQVLLAWTMMAMVWCHCLSRLVPVVLMQLLPYAGDIDHAKAKPLALQVSGGTVTAAIGWTGLISALLWAGWGWSGWPTGTLVQALGQTLVAAVVGATLCQRWFARRLGGFTGDTLGASQQLCELMCLLAWLNVVHPA